MAAMAARKKRRMKSALNPEGGRRRACAAAQLQADILGSVPGQTNPKNDLEFERRMTPFGHLLSGQPFSDNGANWVGAHGYRYGNHPFAQVYVWHRVYALQTSQWTTRDLLWPEERAYGYVNGNPIRLMDPSGMGIGFSGDPDAIAKLRFYFRRLLRTLRKDMGSAYRDFIECLNDNTSPCAVWGGGAAGDAFEKIIDNAAGSIEVTLFIGGHLCSGKTCAYTWKVGPIKYHIHICSKAFDDPRSCGDMSCILAHELVHATGHVHTPGNKAMFECVRKIPRCASFTALHGGYNPK